MSAGLLRGLDRVTVTKLSFFQSIPALLGASLLQGVEEAGNIADGVGWTNTLLAMAVSFVVACFSVSWLLRFIARHSYSIFHLLPGGAGPATDRAAGDGHDRGPVSGVR